MIAPLSHKQQEFLTVMGLADEFTVEMALFITGNPEAGQILSLMTRQNAFITPLPDGVSFRFHHMMKECTPVSYTHLDVYKRQESGQMPFSLTSIFSDIPYPYDPDVHRTISSHDRHRVCLLYTSRCV